MLEDHLKILKEKRKDKGFSLDSVQESLDIEYDIKIDKSNISRYENNKVRTMDARILKALCKIYGINYIDFFKKIDFIDNDVMIQNNKLEVNEPPADYKLSKTVPLYGTASAGPGYINFSVDPVDYSISEKDYKAGRFAVGISGESMTGSGRSIPDGSVALVDRNLCENLSDMNEKVGVFTYNDETYIKKLVVDNQNIIHLVSFNPDVLDIIVLDKKNLKCEGRVVKTYYEQKW